MVANVLDRFEFRSVRANEAEEVAEIEKICFPPHEVCSKKDMFERVEHAPELFLVAVDKETGTIAGFLNGLATDEEEFRDEFFTDIIRKERIFSFWGWMSGQNTAGRVLREKS